MAAEIPLVARSRPGVVDAVAVPAPSHRSFDKARRLLDIIAHPDRHWRMIQAVAGPAFAAMRARQPSLTVKYLNPLHLAAGLSSAERLAAMVHHYTVLRLHVADATRKVLLDQGATIWTHATKTADHRITCCFSHPTDNEGELTLDYAVDGVSLYVLSFTFVAGSLVGLVAPTVLLVSRLQGVRGRRTEMRTAMKSLEGLAPAALLVAAAQGVAGGTGVNHLAVVAAARQVCRAADMAHLVDVYDRFFDGLGATAADGFLRLNLPLVERPLADVKSSSRGRVRAQRAIKHAVTRAARDYFAGAR